MATSSGSGEYKVIDGKLTFVRYDQWKHKKCDKICPRCGTEYHGVRATCNPCRNAEEKTARDHKTGFKPNPHKAAYTHVIRHENGDELFKFSILETPELPKGYDVVYKLTMGGILLPRKYAELRSYHDKQETLDNA